VGRFVLVRVNRAAGFAPLGAAMSLRGARTIFGQPSTAPQMVRHSALRRKRPNHQKRAERHEVSMICSVSARD